VSRGAVADALLLLSTPETSRRLNLTSESLRTHRGDSIATWRNPFRAQGYLAATQWISARSRARIEGDPCHDDAYGYTGWLPTIPVNVLGLGTPGPGLELGTDRVSNRYECRLRHLLIRDPEHFGSVAFVGQVQ
jgi:hypothetical protein